MYYFWLLFIDYRNKDTKFINYLSEIESNSINDNSNKDQKDLIKEYKLGKQNENTDDAQADRNRINSDDNLNANVKRARHHVEHKKLKNDLDEFSQSKTSLEDPITIKTDFEKVSFEVNICYYSSKESFATIIIC